MTCSVAYDGQQGLDAVVKSFVPGEKRFNCILVSALPLSLVLSA